MRHFSFAAALLAGLAGSMSLSGCAVAKIQAQLNSPLAQAVKSDNREATFAALAQELQVRSSGTQGRELILAILEGRKPDAMKLIEGGADVHATITGTLWTMFDGYTPLILAAWLNDIELAKALLDKGADLNATASGGTTPTYRATTPAMVTFLLDKGAPLDSETAQGATPLVSFASVGNNAVVRLLLARGADAEKARAFFEKQIRFLQKDPSIANHPTILDSVRKQREAIELVDRLSQAARVPQAAAASGVTKDELKQMMKEAAAETARPAAAPAGEVVYKSDVDVPGYKVTENPDAYALVVGVEKYHTLPDARFAERDAKAMNAHLLAMGYPQRNIVLLTGNMATRTGLAKNLEAWLPNNVTEKSTVMFYFSGHGAPDAKTSQAYLVPTDGDPQYLEETAYPIKKLYAKLAALKAKRVVVALDSCFSGAGGRSVLAQGTRPLVAKLELAPVEAKVVSLSASSSDEITGALEEQGHGLFTYHLLKALGETAGRGTVAEVYASLKPRVQDEARRQNRAQTPQSFGSTDAGLR